MLDLAPVSALPEHVQLRAWVELEQAQRGRQREHPVLTTGLTTGSPVPAWR